MKFSFLIALLFFAFQASGQFNYDDWRDKGVKDTAQLTIWRYALKKRGSIDGQSVKNDTGRHVQSSSDFEYPDTALLSRKKYHHGLLIYEEGYFPHIDAPWYLHKSYRHDGKNRRINCTEYSSDSSWLETYSISFNDRKKVVVLRHYDHGKLSEKGISKYDKVGRITSKYWYWGDGRLMGRYEYHHSKDGQQVTAINYGNGATIEDFTVYRFDSNSKNLEYILYSRDSVFQQATYYTYNATGQITQKKWVIGGTGEIRELTIYDYNDDENVSMVKQTGENGKSIQTKKYFYNKTGRIDYILSFDGEGDAEAKLVYDYK